ncbi:MAG: T9SS type A sorting domain-containing protein [Bacteroidales bacterium]|nr:T9SS type A sorting domain-containing protein [Candidatus Colicola faecequi]
MKHHFLLCAILALLMSAAPLHAAGNYIDITFGARGEVTTVSSVTVENLSKGTSVTLDGSDILRLGDGTVAVDNISTALTRPLIYPNPAYGEGILAFDAQGGDVAVQIYGINGMLIAARSFDDVAPGRHAINLPALAAGQYVVRLQANGSEEGLTWMCVGTGSNGRIGLDEVSAEAAVLPVKRGVAAATPNVVPMEYTVGDLLRFTGENGNRRTIVMNQPTCDHDIIFDLYECKDANGYYYTCVRAGDLLWMAEDLRPLNNIPDLTVTSSASTWVDANENTPMEFLADGAAYYNLAAIEKVVPAGWHVPSAGEADYMINKLGNHNTVGNLLKSRDFNWERPVNGLDSVSFGGFPNGYIDRDGILQSKNKKGCWITSSTMNHGKVVSMEISLYNDSVYTPISHSHNRYAYALRACRTVASPYQQMMEFFNLAAYEAPARQQAPSRVAPPFRYVSDGPLGAHYEQASTRATLWYNYSGRQYGSTDTENRSGALYKETDNYAWRHHSKAIIPFRSSNPQSVLRKMAAQTRANGYQTCLYAEWSRPFRLMLDENGAVTETPQVCGSGTIAIREMGDLPSGFAAGASRNLLDANDAAHQFTLPSYNSNDKLKAYAYHDSNRLSEVPEAYTIASFNIKCIRDLTGDGIDEIVTAVGEEICVFDGATYRLMYSKNFRGTGGSTHLGFCQIRIEVADVDNDGWEDICALVADGANSCHLNIYRSGRIDQAPMFSNDGINGPIIPNYGFLNDIKVGHVCGQAFPEICVQTRGVEVISGNETTAWNSFLYIYRLQPNDNGSSTTYNLQTVLNGSEIRGYRNNQHDNASTASSAMSTFVLLICVALTRTPTSS